MAFIPRLNVCRARAGSGIGCERARTRAEACQVMELIVDGSLEGSTWFTALHIAPHIPSRRATTLGAPCALMWQQGARAAEARVRIHVYVRTKCLLVYTRVYILRGPEAKYPKIEISRREGVTIAKFRKFPAVKYSDYIPDPRQSR